MPPSNAAQRLHDALDLLDDAIGLSRKAMNHNPSEDEERGLQQLRLRLESERAVLQAEFNAALVEATAVQAPSAAQVNKIAKLSDQVAKATKQADVANEAIVLGGKIFDLATEIVTHG